MDFGDARRILRTLDLPQDGFEELLARLDALKVREPADYAQRYLRQHRSGIDRLKDSRAA